MELSLEKILKLYEDCLVMNLITYEYYLKVTKEAIEKDKVNNSKLGKVLK